MWLIKNDRSKRHNAIGQRDTESRLSNISVRISQLLHLLRKDIEGEPKARKKVDQASPGLEEGWASQRLIAINNSPLLEYTTPRNEIMQIKRKF